MGVIVVGVVELEVVELVVGVVGENCLKEVKVVDEDYLMKIGGGGGGLFAGRCNPLRCVPSARF